MSKTQRVAALFWGGLSFWLLAGLSAGGRAWTAEPKVYEQPSQSGQVIITKEKPAPPKQIKQSLSQLPLKKGMNGPAISQLHNLLRLAGFACLKFEPDDAFSDNTESAVRRFQHGESAYLKKYLGWQGSDTLSATGFVDKPTADTLVRLTSGYELAVYIVKSGDTLGRISGQAKVSVDQIAAFNDFSARHILQIGERLYLPVPKKPTAEQK